MFLAILMALFTPGDAVAIHAYASLAKFGVLVALQPQQAPPVRPAQAPPIQAEKVAAKLAFPNYNEAIASGNRPFVAFVGVKPREVKGVAVATAKAIYHDEQWQASGVIVVRTDGYVWLPADADDAMIRRNLAPKAVSRPATFFGKRQAATADDDDGPWLSREETAKIKAAWPKGVPFSKTLKFYSLAPRYQNLWTENNGTFHGWRADPLDDEFHPFLVSGGMANIDASKWKSVKGLDIPEGETISVWKESTDVRAFSLVPRWRWQFPEKTVAYDVLFSGDDIFEIRTQERTADGWETNIPHKDKSLAPLGYTGAGVCSSCHSSVGSIQPVPGRIYLRERWGSDGRFSWRPYKEDGTLDERWPIASR